MQATLPLPSSLSVWQRRLEIVLPLLAIVAFVLGLAWQNAGLIGGGAVALCALWRSVGKQLSPAKLFAPSTRKRNFPTEVERTRDMSTETASAGTITVVSPGEHLATRRSSQPSTAMSHFVEDMIYQSRYALLLHPETVTELGQDDIEKVIEIMDEYMSVVPEGKVLLGEYADRATWGSSPGAADVQGLVQVAGCYLDRYTVTNAQFQHFVDAGGYEQFQLWPDEALPALFEFVDRTGVPAPAFWLDGHYLDGEGTLPVVGISWYEAAAYARWVGKRLPTDAEWTKAGAWPVETSPGRVTQRRYPWGDTFEARRAALWSSGLRGPSPVDAYTEGTSLGGVQQLIGNVWEWTTSPLDSSQRESAGDSHALKVIHGGAFNTYFENQATCHFRSGERPLARRANIGVRLALSFETVAEPENEPTGTADQELEQASVSE